MKKKSEIAKKISDHVEESIIQENLEDMLVSDWFDILAYYQYRAIPDVEMG